LCQHLHGWAKHTSGVNKKEKKEVLDNLDKLDKRVESTLLTPSLVDFKQCLQSHLSQHLREEEIKLYQRSKAKNLMDGDSNTKYFHLLANGKHRKIRIFQMQDKEDKDKQIFGDIDLKKHITSYYKGLFGPPHEDSFRLDESRGDDIPQVTVEENRILVEEIMEEEVRKALFQMEHNKTSGPDGFLVEFYQTFRHLIKSDMMALFHEFHQGTLPLYSLNFGMIILFTEMHRGDKNSAIPSNLFVEHKLQNIHKDDH
jgi:hypothetical protein